MKGTAVIFVCSFLGLLICGCSRPAGSGPAAQTSAFPADARVQQAVNQMLAQVRKNAGSVTVKGVRRTPDGGGEADLVFQNFEYVIGYRQVFSGEGVATIAHYSDGFYLTRVSFNIGDIVNGKLPL